MVVPPVSKSSWKPYCRRDLPLTGIRSDPRRPSVGRTMIPLHRRPRRSRYGRYSGWFPGFFHRRGFGLLMLVFFRNVALNGRQPVIDLFGPLDFESTIGEWSTAAKPNDNAAPLFGKYNGRQSTPLLTTETKRFPVRHGLFSLHRCRQCACGQETKATAASDQPHGPLRWPCTHQCQHGNRRCMPHQMPNRQEICLPCLRHLSNTGLSQPPSPRGRCYTATVLYRY